MLQSFHVGLLLWILCSSLAGAQIWSAEKEREQAETAIARAAPVLRQAPFEKFTSALEKLRGHPFKTPVDWTMRTPDDVRKFLKAEMASSYPARQVKLDESMLKVLGLAERDFELIPFLEDLLTEQIAGAYDPKSKQFFLVRSSSYLGNAFKSLLEDFEVLAVHELDHALQDQHFDLLGLQTRMKKWSTDQQQAAQAVFEGEATLVMTDYTLMGTGTTADDNPVKMSEMADLMTNLPALPGLGSFARAPLYFKRSLIFPYYGGMDFVREIRRFGGWPMVDRLYTHLPASTEQVYHPEKYLAREEPVPVSLARWPERLGDWRSLGEDTGGEFLVRVVVEQHSLGSRDDLGSGWAGDRYRIYENSKGELSMLWVIDWDSEQDAAEFHDAVRKTKWHVEKSGTQTRVFVNLPDQLNGLLFR